MRTVVPRISESTYPQPNKVGDVRPQICWCLLKHHSQSSWRLKINDNQDSLKRQSRLSSLLLLTRDRLSISASDGERLYHCCCCCYIRACDFFRGKKMGVGRQTTTTGVGSGIINSLHGSNQASRGTVVASKPSRRKSCEHPSCHKQPAFS